MDKTAVVDCLNELIETSRDGEQGFMQCAEKANDPKLRTFFAERASECRTGIDQLTQCVTRYGGEAQASGSTAAAAHRAWITVREGVTNSDASLLVECERGQDRAVAAWRKALDVPLPDDVRSLVQQQMAGVQRNHDQVKALRDQYRAAG